MDNLYMHLGMAWSVMNYSSISYLAGELYRISTMLYQVRPCVYVVLAQSLVTGSCLAAVGGRVFC